MEHDHYKEFMAYYTPPGTREYTAYKVLTKDEVLEYSLNTLNKVFAEVNAKPLLPNSK